MDKKNEKKLKKMSFEEIDKYIDNLPYNWMKPFRYQAVIEVRPDYIPKHRRNKKKEGE